MKKGLTVCLILILTLTVSTKVFAEEKRYDFESAVIELNISGHIQGKETAYIDKWGAREARLSDYTLDMTGQEKPQKKLMLLDGDWSYSIDLIRRQMIRIDLNQEMAPGLNIELTAKEMSDYSTEGLRKMGAVKVGEETVAGKMCQVYELPFLDGKVWVYKRVALKYQSKARAFQATYTATNIQENVDIAESRFLLPRDVEDLGVLEKNTYLGAVQPPKSLQQQ